VRQIGSDALAPYRPVAGQLRVEAYRVGLLHDVHSVVSQFEMAFLPASPIARNRKAVAYRIVQALRMQEKRGGKIKRTGRLGNAIVWSRAGI
jgi:hypothetical protein